MGSHGEEKCNEKINDIRFEHQFCIKTIDGKTLIWGNNYSIVAEWGSSSGLAFLNFIPYHPIFA